MSVAPRRAALVDANVLVYAHDDRYPEKREQAITVLDWLVVHKAGLFSTQVVAEFFWTITRKFAKPIPVPEAAVQVTRLAKSWPVASVTLEVVQEALRGAQA